MITKEERNRLAKRCFSEAKEYDAKFFLSTPQRAKREEVHHLASALAFGGHKLAWMTEEGTIWSEDGRI